MQSCTGLPSLPSNINNNNTINNNTYYSRVIQIKLCFSSLGTAQHYYIRLMTGADKQKFHNISLLLMMSLAHHTKRVVIEPGYKALLRIEM